MTGGSMFASSSNTRKGLTLLEVLITIFVMGIGMLSVLTLFPLAARKIGMSIDMDRASQAAANASALSALPFLPSNISIRDAATKFFDDTCNTDKSAGRAVNGPSVILYYDGAGFKAGNNSTSIGGLSSVFAPHSTTGKPWAWPILGRGEIVSLDEYPFSDAGIPESLGRRSERYSTSFLFRRNRLDDENSMETVILVYAGRPFDFGNQNERSLTLSAPGVSSAFPNSNGSSEIQITDSFPVSLAGTPDRVIQRGSWIVDVSDDLPSPPGNGKPRWKKFYQVMSVDPSTGILSIDRPLEGDLSKAVWLDYLINWFDRGTAP
jgi:prepilin-type N-terminal cleavage/methylation domain-containing protein